MGSTSIPPKIIQLKPIKKSIRDLHAMPKDPNFFNYTVRVGVVSSTPPPIQMFQLIHFLVCWNHHKMDKMLIKFKCVYPNE
jgi:hypothetical protein